MEVVNSIGDGDVVVGADVLKSTDAGYVFTLADIGWRCEGKRNNEERVRRENKTQTFQALNWVMY